MLRHRDKTYFIINGLKYVEAPSNLCADSTSFSTNETWPHAYNPEVKHEDPSRMVPLMTTKRSSSNL